MYIISILLILSMQILYGENNMNQPKTTLPISIKSDKSILELDHANIEYEKFYCEESKDNIPVIVLHGGPGFTYDYLLSIKDTAHQYPIIFYNQSGAGKSIIKEKPDNFSLEYFVDELLMVINHLGLKKVHLLGHCWGALLAVEAALKAPEKIESLILESPCLSIKKFQEDTNKLWQKFSPTWYDKIMKMEDKFPTKIGFMKAIENNKQYEETLLSFRKKHFCRLEPWPEKLIKSFRNMNTDICFELFGPHEFRSIGIMRNYNCLPRAKKLTLPVLLIGGAHSITGSEALEAYRNEIPNANLAILENSSMMPHLEEPKSFNNYITKFIASID